MVKQKFNFSERSLNRLQYAHPDLVKITKRAIQLSPFDFGITESIRSFERQQEMLAKGLSQTLKSKHLPDEQGYSRAIDIVAYINGKVTWDWEPYIEISKAFKEAAKEYNLSIIWGGDWQTIKDGVHFELKG